MPWQATTASHGLELNGVREGWLRPLALTLGGGRVPQ